MKLLIISTNVMKLTPTGIEGYGGVEYLVSRLATGLALKGHSVAVVCPEGSQLTEGMEIIPTGLMEDEEKSWQRYRGRLEQGEFEVILDSSWQRWATMSSAGRDPELALVNWFHSHESCYPTQPPVRYPMWVGLSRAHASNLSRAFKTPCRFVYNGIDLDFYKPTGAPKGSRYLWLARWTVEKAGMEVIDLAQRCKVGVDMYGDTAIVGDQNYVRACFARADGFFAKANPGVSREVTVDLYSKAHGFLLLLNWEEPFGLSLIESQACGCVPIVSRRGAAPELIRDGITGFLVDDADQMGALLARDAVKEIKPETMRKWVEKKFGLPRFVDDWEALLRRVVGGGERW